MTAEATERDLVTEAQVAEIESRLKLETDADAVFVLSKVPALIRDWRAMNELVFVPKVLPDDEPLTYRDEAARLLRENTDLRKQLAEVTSRLEACQRRRQDQQELINELRQTVTLAEITAQTMAEIGDEL